MTNLTFERVVARLVDGLNYTDDELNQIKEWLLGYQIANQLTVKELDDLCFSDSAWIFDHVFAANDRDYDEDEDRGW